MRYATLTPLNTASGSRRYASPGCTSQGELKPVFICECGTPVVWVKSKRTGKNYIANVFAGYTDALHYRGNSIHDRNLCADALADKAARAAHIETQAVNAELHSANPSVAAALRVCEEALAVLVAAAEALNAYEAWWDEFGGKYDTSAKKAFDEARTATVAATDAYNEALTEAGSVAAY